MPKTVALRAPAAGAVDPAKSGSRGKILFFVTEDWYFCSHRLPLAVAAKQAGYEVAVATRVRAHGQAILAAGLRLIPLELSRGGRNPLTEWLTVWRLFRVYRRERPDLVHHVALKPVLYGSLAARLAGVPRVVNALTGLGHIFAESNRAGLLRWAVKGAIRKLLGGRRSRVIVQNPDDLRRLSAAAALDPKAVALIRGAGVDLAQFRPHREPEGPPVVVLAARMLWDKGVGEFVAAATQLTQQGIVARFVLVGDADHENHSAIPTRQLETWKAQGPVDWWGRREDMPAVFAACHIVCLPSYYGEGVPKVLLEAAAAGRPIVTTDMPGCREVVRDGDNGFLVPPKNVSALAAALARLLENPPLRARMGRRGREIAEAEFGVERVIEATLAVYRGLLQS
ncbi:glycosyltransferase family 4 protein [Candidatus Methylocalor cossyra]|uniref:Glycosyltransferase family 1 protein n=1 Tax=Candidatus Methylocalor cossyra TaxID=3108543 RepID=A0ABP1C571_9GAMM